MSSSKRKRQRRERETRSEESTTEATDYGHCPSVADRYEKIGRLGEGTYGVVYKARDRRSADRDRIVALKRCIPHHQASDGFPTTALREINALRICRDHPNVVTLETVAVSRSGVFLVFEYCEHDLAVLVDGYFKKRNRSPFSEAAVKTLTRQLLSALDVGLAYRILLCSKG